MSAFPPPPSGPAPPTPDRPYLPEADFVDFDIIARGGRAGAVDAATYEVVADEFIVRTRPRSLLRRVLLPTWTIVRIDRTCARSGWRCAVRSTEPRPDRTSRHNTIANAAVGDRLVITASVDRRFDSRSFVIEDVDLPPGGLLLLVREPSAAEPPMLITVDGTVIRFRYQDFRDLPLGEARLYEPYEGQRTFLADRMRVL